MIDLHIAAVAARKHSSSSSNLTGRQQSPSPGQLSLAKTWGLNPAIFDLPSDVSDSTGPSHDSTTDCDSKDKSHKDDGKTHDDQNSTTTVNPNPDSNPTTTTTATGPAPAIARRHSRRPMGRGSKNSPSIFERDEEPATPSGNPITVGDILNTYLNQRAAARKRAPRPRTTRNFY